MLILPFAYHVEQFNTGQNGLCPAKRFKSLHRAYSTFDISMILLNQVVQLLALPDGDSFFIRFADIKCDQRRHVSAAFINGHLLRLIEVSDGLAKET